jgi:hypothetical protein
MKKFVVIGLCVSVFACSTPAVEKPDLLLEKEQMVAILYDLSILNAVSDSKKDYLKQRNIVPIKTIYSWYGIDSLIFAQNDLYYASKPKEYLEIYKKVNDSLEATKEVYDELVRQELLKRKDSVDNSRKIDSLTPVLKAPPKRPPMRSNQ